MRRKYKDEFKEEVIERYHKGNISIATLAKEYNIPQNTLGSWVR